MYTVITQPGCAHCIEAKMLLNIAEIAFQTFDISLNENKWMKALLKQGNVKTVPQIYSDDGSLIGGNRELTELLEHLRRFS